MYCSTCGKAIPEESVFCMFCGKKIGEKTEVAPIPVNNQPPTALSGLSIYLAKEMQQNKWNKNMVGRKIDIYIKLADKDGRSTAYDGSLKIKGQIEQLGDVTAYTKVRGRVDKEIQVKSSDFYRATKGDGDLWFKFTLEYFIDISVFRAVNGKIEAWFTPWDAADKKNKLYRMTNIALSPDS